MEELKINVDNIGKGKDNYDIVESCAAPFNKCMLRIVHNSWAKIKKLKNDPTIDAFVKKQETIDSFERLKNNIELVRFELPYFAISRCFPHFINASKHIMERNSDYFLNRDYATLIKNDHNKTMIYDVINLVCKCFNKLTLDEQDEIWELANIMLLCALEFKKHIKQTGIQYGQDTNLQL
jgi:hypothetical protein